VPQRENTNNKRSLLKKIAFGGAVVGTASLGVYYANQPKQIEYDVEGNQLFLMQLDSSSFLNLDYETE